MEWVAGVGSVAGVAAVAVAIWQLRVAVLERRERRQERRPRGAGRVVAGARPVDAPVGRLPGRVVGREALLSELRTALRRRRSAGVWVLAGLGGMGKSTVALTIAAEAARSGRTVWWVNAGDQVSMHGALLEVLRHTAAPDDVLQEVRDGRPTAPGRFWRHLAEARPNALMVFDNADNPAVLSVDGHGSPGDGDGWIRPGTPVFLLVTTRNADARTWGEWVSLRRLGALPDDQAAALLRGIAPDVQDPGGTGAGALARRLGGLPLALRLAGTYLASPFSQWSTFDDYRAALDTDDAAIADLDVESSGRITRTWEVSLDALTAQGLPRARPLLYLLACFDPLTPALGSVVDTGDAGRTLRGLADLALVDVAAGTGAPAVTVHPVVADMCRARLRSDDDGDVVRTAVAHLLQAGTGLDPERVTDWPGWERLVPHLAAFVGWAGPQADDASLVSLLMLGRKATAALRLKTSAGGEDLAELLTSAAARLGPADPAAIMTRYDSAMLYLRAGDHGQAETALEAVLDSARRVLGSQHRDTLLIRDGLAGLYLTQQRFGEAEQAYRALIADQDVVLGQEDADTLATHVDLAWAVGMQGRAAEAAEICEAVARAEHRLFGPHHVRTLDARSDHARWLLETGRVEEARRTAEDVLAGAVRVLGADHPMCLLTRATLAKASAVAGQDTDAVFAEILRTLQDVVGPHDYRTAIVRRDRAEAAAARRDRDGPA